MQLLYTIGFLHELQKWLRHSIKTDPEGFLLTPLYRGFQYPLIYGSTLILFSNLGTLVPLQVKCLKRKWYEDGSSFTGLGIKDIVCQDPCSIFTTVNFRHTEVSR